jgi:hypothetical protein
VVEKWMKSSIGGEVLTLCEGLFLLAINDEKSAITPSARELLRYGLAGRNLAELALQGRITIEDSRVVSTDQIPTGDIELDETMSAIAAEDKPRKMSHWINTLGSIHLMKKYAGRLAEKGVIRLEEKRFLWVIPTEIYPEQDASAKYWVKHELRAMVLAGGKPEPQRVVLLNLMNACRLLNLVFTKDERKAAEKRSKNWSMGKPLEKQLKRPLKISKQR